MLQAAHPPSYSLRKRSLDSVDKDMADRGNHDDAPASDDDADDIGGKEHTRSKSRRELPAGAVATLKAWLLSPEHFTHPYPTPQDQAMLMQKTGIDKKQLKNWFTNARRRIWKPMLKKQLEQGKLTVTGAGGGGVAVPGVVPGLMVPNMSGGIAGQTDQDVAQQQGIRVHYQPAAAAAMQAQVQSQPQNLAQHQHQQEAPSDNYSHSLFLAAGGPAAAAVAAAASRQLSSMQPFYESAPASLTTSTVGSPHTHTHTPAPASMQQGGNPLSKTDSHAVLMELFARDQDLVKQATESAGLKTTETDDHIPSQSLTAPSNDQQRAPSPGASQQANVHQASTQHPMRIPSQGRLVNVPTLNSWPHFSSVSSLNNLSTMPGVKSITSLSGVDLANQGPVNRVGNLAQVKSVESMGKNDSYAFLEVFFGDRQSTYGANKDHRGIKRQREEDNDVGLSLEDEGPTTTSTAATTALVKQEMSMPAPAPLPSYSESSSSIFAGANGSGGTVNSGTLKRAYDDALAAHGLISVSRSCEKLTDLALPAKMQRTLSQEYLGTQHHTDVQLSDSAPENPENGQHRQQHQKQCSSMHSGQVSQEQGRQHQSITDSKGEGVSVEVPFATKCAVCHQTNVDTQLRPCGHMFHERCLKPTLQSAIGAPKCPIDHIPMQSALLAIPSDEPGTSNTLLHSASVGTWNKDSDDSPDIASANVFAPIPSLKQSET